MKNTSKTKLRLIYIFVTTLTLFLINFNYAVLAQNIPPEAIPQIQQELIKRGLTEGEVRARLLQRGIDLENTPPAELPKYQAQVTAVLDELEAEKKAGSTASTEVHPKISGTNTAINIVTPVEPITTKEEAVAEAAHRVIQNDAKEEEKVGETAIYGHSLFTDQSLEVFRTTDGAQAPDTYVLGDGDEVRVTIFGASQTDIQQKIGPDGYIQPSGVSKIFLKGLTLAQARSVIQERLSSAYTFRSDQFAVTIITARTIMVHVFGEARITGGFSISALNSALNALAAAGGPSKIGSVRSIQLIRGTNRREIDLYAFMNDPSTQFRFDLQNNDILFVPVAKLLVSIEGAVKRPMSYEMLPNETLTNLISYAGDLRMDVFPDFVQIQRYDKGELRLFEYNLEDVRSGKIKVPLQNGDIVRIKSIGKPMDQYVDIEGSVYYPGRYDLSANKTLKELFVHAQPTLQAKTDLIFIERIRPDETIEQLSVSLAELQNLGQDFKLTPRDRVRIYELANYRDVASISVQGQVRTPFVKDFSLTDRLTVKQAIEMAGGLKNSVYPVAYIFRRNLLNPVEMEYIRIELNKSENIILQPGDQLNIYDNSTFTNVGEVRVFGAVKNPRSFTYDPSLSIMDVLTNAGGFNVGAALNKIEVFRTILSPTEKVRIDLITLEVDSSYHVISPQYFRLQPYDQIVVRLTPEFTMGRTIEITGQVVYPGFYPLNGNKKHLSEIIKTSGGLLDDADPLGSSLFRTYHNRGNISMNVQKAIQKTGKLQFDPILFEGDVININRYENTVSIRGNGTRMAQYSINPEITDTKNVVYQGNRSAAWYIRNHAGGFVKQADRNSITVTLPNNQMLSTKRYFFLVRNYPNAHPGSVISMQMKPPKEEKEKREKTSWGEIWQSTLAAVTTAVTIIVLSKQL